MSIPNGNVEKEDEEASEIPPPPDGGWGWVVVFGSFMIHIVTDGVTYSFGVFYDEFLDYFQEGKGATAWILSILVGITLCSGPISSSLVNRWGCRAVTIAGALLASFCLIISCWAQNVTTLYFTIGIGTGFGFGLIYLPAIVSVTTYFEKRRSLATGIAVCGSGFGTFLFAPFINLLLSEYGWRGGMLIIAGIVLECVLFGALFRPLEYKQSESTTDIAPSFHKIEPSPLSVNNKDGYSSEHNIPLVVENDNRIERPRSMGFFSAAKPVAPEKNGFVPNQNIKSLDTARLAVSHPVLSLTQSEGGRYSHYGSQHLKRHRLFKKPDIFYTASLFNIPNYKSHRDLKSSDEEDLMQRRPSRISKHSNAHEDDSKSGCLSCSNETKDTLNEMLNFSLFKDPVFVLFTLSNFFTSVGFNIPYVYIVPKAKALDISSDEASILLSVIGIANTIGRIILGYFSDNPNVNRLLVYNLCLTICGTATALSAFCSDFYSLAIYGSIFGFTIGAYVGLTSVILVDLLGIQKLTNAFGLLLLFQGIASLIGPPIAGELYDLLKSYDPGFYVAGVTIALSGIMLFAIPPLQKYRRNKERNKRTNI